MGDNARAPYGTRSFEVVYDFTLQAVKKLFELGCPLVILACNTASAKALRSIQQNDLPHMDPTRRVLGVIRPTVECIGEITRNGHVGLLATAGTVRSESYPLEIKKIFPDIQVTGMACPMWVPLVENKEYDGDGADYFVKKYIDTILQKDPDIDTLILGCTHYPLLLQKIRQYTPSFSPQNRSRNSGNRLRYSYTAQTYMYATSNLNKTKKWSASESAHGGGPFFVLYDLTSIQPQKSRAAHSGCPDLPSLQTLPVHIHIPDESYNTSNHPRRAQTPHSVSLLF